MEIKVLDQNFDIIGLIESADSFYWVDRFNKPGEFEIYTEISRDLIALLQEDNYLQIPDSDKTMIIESIRLKPDVELGNKLVSRGRSLESLLDRRIVWTQTLIDSMNLETGIFQFLDDAFITGVSDTNRIVDNFVLTASGDTAITGIDLTIQLDADNCLELVNILTKSNNVGWKILLNSNLEFEFELYSGTDRSFDQSTNPHVVFSPQFDNLINSDYVRSKRPYKNAALWVGDESETSALVRGVMFFPGATNVVGINRREVYLDQSNYSRFVQGTTDPIDALEYTSQMQQTAKQTLQHDYDIYSAFDGVADTTVQYVYGQDFFLGDVVQIENEYGMTAKSRVTEMTFSEDESGIHNYPTFETI